MASKCSKEQEKASISIKVGRIRAVQFVVMDAPVRNSSCQILCKTAILWVMSSLMFSTCRRSCS